MWAEDIRRTFKCLQWSSASVSLTVPCGGSCLKVACASCAYLQNNGPGRDWLLLPLPYGACSTEAKRTIACLNNETAITPPVVVFYQPRLVDNMPKIQRRFKTSRLLLVGPFTSAR